MADYKNIPVDQETYDMLVALCEANDRKQGAQVKALVKPAYEQLEQNRTGERKEVVSKKNDTPKV